MDLQKLRQLALLSMAKKKPNMASPSTPVSVPNNNATSPTTKDEESAASSPTRAAQSEIPQNTSVNFSNQLDEADPEARPREANAEGAVPSTTPIEQQTDNGDAMQVEPNEQAAQEAAQPSSPRNDDNHVELVESSPSPPRQEQASNASRSESVVAEASGVVDSNSSSSNNVAGAPHDVEMKEATSPTSNDSPLFSTSEEKEIITSENSTKKGKNQSFPQPPPIPGISPQNFTTSSPTTRRPEAVDEFSMLLNIHKKEKMQKTPTLEEREEERDKRELEDQSPKPQKPKKANKASKAKKRKAKAKAETPPPMPQLTISAGRKGKNNGWTKSNEGSGKQTPQPENIESKAIVDMDITSPMENRIKSIYPPSSAKAPSPQPLAPIQQQSKKSPPLPDRIPVPHQTAPVPAIPPAQPVQQFPYPQHPQQPFAPAPQAPPMVEMQFQYAYPHPPLSVVPPPQPFYPAGTFYQPDFNVYPPGSNFVPTVQSQPPPPHPAPQPQPQPKHPAPAPKHQSKHTAQKQQVNASASNTSATKQIVENTELSDSDEEMSSNEKLRALESLKRSYEQKKMELEEVKKKEAEANATLKRKAAELTANEETPTKRQRKSYLNPQETVNPNELAVLNLRVKEIELKLRQHSKEVKDLEVIVEAEKKKLLDHQQKRVKLEMKRRIVAEQLRLVEQLLEDCASEEREELVKVNAEQTLIDKKKADILQLQQEYENIKLKLYEVELHSSLDVLSDVVLPATVPTPSPVASPLDEESRKAYYAKPKAPKSSPVAAPKPFVPPPTKRNITKKKNKQKAVPVKEAEPSNGQKQALQSKQEQLEEELLNKKRELEELKKTKAQKQSATPQAKGTVAATALDFIALEKNPTPAEVEKLPSPTVQEPAEELPSAVQINAEDFKFYTDMKTPTFLVTRYDNFTQFMPIDERLDSFASTLNLSELTKETSTASEHSKHTEASTSTSYESPLLKFGAYRMNPLFTSKWGHAISSPSFTNKIDPFTVFCRFELDGQCNNANCQYQHAKDYLPSQDDVVKDLVSYFKGPSANSHMIRFKKQLKSGTVENVARSIATFVQQKAPKSSLSELTEAHEKPTSKLSEKANHRRSTKGMNEPMFDANISSLIKSQILSDERRYFDQISLEEYENHVVANPNDVEYWIKYSMKYIADQAVENEEPCHGVARGLNILSQALEKNTKSVDLWMVYLQLYSSEHNVHGREEELRQLFEHAVRYNEDSLILWSEYITSEKDLTRRVDIINRAIEKFTQLLSESANFVERSQNVTCLILEQLRTLCIAGKVDYAKKVLHKHLSEYVSKSESIEIDSDEDERPASDVRESYPRLEDKHLSTLWLTYIALLAYNVYPFPTYYQGAQLLMFVESGFAIDFNFGKLAVPEEDIRNAFEKAIKRFQLPRTKYCLSLCINSIQFEIATKNYVQARQLCQDFIGEHLDCPEVWSVYVSIEEAVGHIDDAETIFLRTLQFYPGCTSIWYKYILHIAKYNCTPQDRYNPVAKTLSKCIHACLGLTREENEESDDYEHIQSLFRTALGLNPQKKEAEDDEEDETKANLRKDVFMWLIYLTFEAIHQPFAEVDKKFKEALRSFEGSPVGRQKLWIEYILYSKFNSSSDTRYLELIDQCIQYTLSDPSTPYMNYYSWPVLKNLSKGQPLLQGLVWRLLIKDYSYCNQVLKIFLDDLISPKNPNVQTVILAEAINSALQTMPGNVPLISLWVEQEAKAGNWNTVGQLLTKSIQQFPNNIMLYTNFLRFAKHYPKERARSCFEEAVAKNPFSATLWSEYVKFEEQKGNLDTISKAKLRSTQNTGIRKHL